MRKGKRMVLLLLTGLAVLTTASCSSGNEAEKMDFHEQMEWKIPDPALGERPRILFVGNSHTFYNNFSGMFVNIVEAKGKKSRKLTAGIVGKRHKSRKKFWKILQKCEIPRRL